MTVEATEQAAPEAAADPGPIADGDAAEAEGGDGEAFEEAEAPRGKPSKAKAEAAKFSEIRKLARAQRDLESKIDRIQAERDQINAELARERDNNQRFRDSLKRDYTGVLQRELNIPREELLAQQADEANVSPAIRRELIELRQVNENYAKQFNSAIEQIRAERTQERFERGVEADVDKALKLVDEEVHPHFSALPAGEQAARIEIAVRRAVETGRAKHLNRGTLLEELDSEVEEIVTHIRGKSYRRREDPEVREETPKAPTRAVGARGKAAPPASGPMDETERRDWALRRAKERRLAREQAQLEKQRAKTAAKGG